MTTAVVCSSVLIALFMAVVQICERSHILGPLLQAHQCSPVGLKG